MNDKPQPVVGAEVENGEKRLLFYSKYDLICFGYESYIFQEGKVASSNLSSTEGNFIDYTFHVLPDYKKLMNLC